MTELRIRWAWFRYFLTGRYGDKCRKCAWGALLLDMPRRPGQTDADWAQALRWRLYEVCRGER